ncbi:ribosomal protein L7Ae [Megasphaera lornae]|uniref:Ribosomal protein L7Ae n=1 Tax=Megasphaera lornae TaxID=1000568 RepID=D3LWM1_9FIRM|nr:ribosomal L7Ae/L30e/S12e/Gadd45 family protein [Megasphaera genomosp. type_1]EFD93258.1 ribosomal protein L7Ae [Megasphaera genomosp. type_1 str. 28L]
MTVREKILNLLGIAYRARKVLCGDFAVSAYMQKSKVPLLFLASDSGKDNREKYRHWCAQKNITIIDIYTKEELGRAAGNKYHVVIGVTDAGLARAMRKERQAMV